MSDNYFKAFLKDNFTVILASGLVYFKALLIIPIIIKTVGINVYGGFVLMSSFIGLVYGISSSGIGFKTRRLLPSVTDVEEKRKLYYPQFYFGLFSLVLVSLLVVLFIDKIDTYLFKDDINYSIIIVLLNLFMLHIYSQGTDYFRYTSRIKYMVAGTLIAPYIDIGLILLIIIFYGSISINLLLLSQTISFLLVGSFCFVIISKELGLRFINYTWISLVSDLKLGLPLMLNYIQDFILSGSDRYLIAFYLSITYVGYYNPAYVLGSMIILIPKAMGTVLPQLLSKAIDQMNQDKAEIMLNYAIKIFLFVAIPFIFGASVISKDILVLFANSDVAENAYFVTPIVAAGLLFYGLNLILSNILFVRMRTTKIFKMNLLAASFNILTNVVLLYFIKSLYVPAITTLLSYLITFIYIINEVKLDWHVDIPLKVVSKIILSSLIMYSILVFIFNNLLIGSSVLIIISQFLLSIVVYFASLFALKTFSQKEIQFVKNIFAG